MLREKSLALATRWARHTSKDSWALAWSAILAANGLVLLLVSGLPAISSLVLAMIGLYLLGVAIWLFERAGFIELIRETGAGVDESGDPAADHSG